MDKIIYDGEEYKDCLYVTTTYKPSLKMRLSFLFCASATMEHKVYAKDIVPQTKAICTVHIQSLADKVRNYFRTKQGYGQMQAPMEERSCDTL